MSNKLLTIFNDHFNEFVCDVQNVFPEDTEILAAKNALLAMRKANPKLICRIWLKYIVEPYQKEIEAGDIDFFLKKDYSNDLGTYDHADRIMTSIDRLRKPIRQMSEENLAKTVKYIQNLSKLSLMVPQ
jgi:hypothetical protein